MTHLNAQGDLLLDTAEGVWREQRPRAWEITSSGKQPVAIAWRLHSDGTVGFATGHHDRRRPLLIDPAISYSTYLANATTANLAAATSTAVDSVGNVYVAGWIEGSNLGAPSTAQAANNGGVDAFLIKLNPAGTILFATYFGGSGTDQALGVAVDASGQPWITGVTSSINLPMKKPFQSVLAGYWNAFIAQFSSTGSLLFSSYLGGSGTDAGNGITADTVGNVYIVGDTQSANFPILQAAQSSSGGGQDAFVAKVNAAGTLVSATYFGGSATEHGAGIAVDGIGAAYVTGGTFSADFPTRSALQRSIKGVSNAFILKLSTSGALVYSTFLGGSGGLSWPEQGSSIAVDAKGERLCSGRLVRAIFLFLDPWSKPLSQAGRTHLYPN